MWGLKVVPWGNVKQKDFKHVSVTHGLRPLTPSSGILNRSLHKTTNLSAHRIIALRFMRHKKAIPVQWRSHSTFSLFKLCSSAIQGSVYITGWIVFFFSCLHSVLQNTEFTIKLWLWGKMFTLDYIIPDSTLSKQSLCFKSNEPKVIVQKVEWQTQQNWFQMQAPHLELTLGLLLALVKVLDIATHFLCYYSMCVKVLWLL